MNRKTIDTLWEIWTYDVWGNRQDGYDVNDRFCLNSSYPLRLKVKTANFATPQEFQYAYPSDFQLKQLFGVSCKIDTDGNDINIYVNRESDNYPIGELNCISHESLSPIRIKNEDMKG